ncbi:hypothetical protein CIT292_11094 [Citrobacter youngae ATCC 29220]|uniref:Uncharacterized protein n=1 Tax=Citrobacter youngae ATCC 29220 TaxID=500640 RepID=D4BKL3_9ENTR|nr:hypothetical protein CIT292_11094 [Citrobacter youngae ATCC 29220]
MFSSVGTCVCVVGRIRRFYVAIRHSRLCRMALRLSGLQSGLQITAPLW